MPDHLKEIKRKELMPQLANRASGENSIQHQDFPGKSTLLTLSNKPTPLCMRLGAEVSSVVGRATSSLARGGVSSSESKGAPQPLKSLAAEAVGEGGEEGLPNSGSALDGVSCSGWAPASGVDDEEFGEAGVEPG